MTERPSPGSHLAADRLLVNLASDRLGAVVEYVNDEFFAPASALLRPEPPEWREGVYTDRGKWMDGWETRRRREPGHDVCVIRLGAPGRAREVVVDTSHFRGNQPESFSLDGAESEGEDGGTAARFAGGAWFPLLERCALAPDTVHRFPVERGLRITHVRLRIFPDGGIARLRVLGTVLPDWAPPANAGPVDLVALVHGGVPVAVSDASFGDPRNLLLPGEARDMGEGWETRRRRGEGHDWVVLALGHRGRPERVEISTRHFKGNYPAACSLDGWDAGPGRGGGGADGPATLVGPRSEDAWIPLVGRSELRPDARHDFSAGLLSRDPVTHVRLAIYPDGGVARLRVFGRPVVET